MKDEIIYILLLDNDKIYILGEHLILRTERKKVKNELMYINMTIKVN